MQNRAFQLMKIWCDALLTYRVQTASPELHGTLLCPACHVVHGRIADLVFPLSVLWDKTGDRRYLETADQLIEWTQRTLSRPDGSWRNDAGNEWKCTTAFAALSIGEALFHLGDRLPADLHGGWLRRFVQLADFVYTAFPRLNPVVNYYAGAAACLAMAWRLTGDGRYRTAADAWETRCRAHFDADGLLFGEGSPLEHVTEKGCRYIDMGYNLEESLPLLLRYASLTGEGMDYYRARLRDHLAFLLPDGGVDNSFGSRHNKWTWWGSRTSDGIIEGLALVLDDPLFAAACERALTLWEQCTADGLLSLPMAAAAGEPTCLHHTFCHAKALAALVLADTGTPDRAPLPAESDGIRFYQNGTLALITHGPWRATVSACDAQYLPQTENGGGALTLLMHGKTPVCASTMHSYTPSEPLNMQYLRRSDQTPCMTPRLVFEDGTDMLTEKNVHLRQTGPAAVAAIGPDWSVEYSFGETVTVTVESERPAAFILPIIRNCGICAEADGIAFAPDLSGFNQVGGFIWDTQNVPVKKIAKITLKGLDTDPVQGDML